jgi:hypothetical protein
MLLLPFLSNNPEFAISICNQIRLIAAENEVIDEFSK